MTDRQHDAPARRPPEDGAAEDALIGAALMKPDAYDIAIEAGLRGDHFYGPANARVWQAIGELVEAGEPVNPMTVTSRLDAQRVLEDIGGLGKMLHYQASVPSLGADSIAHSARRVAATAKIRSLIAGCSEGLEIAYGPWTDAADVQARVQARVDAALDHDHTAAHTLPLARSMPAWSRRAFGDEPTIAGVPTGWAGLDNLTGGLRPGQLITVGARPGMGKSTWGLQICIHWSRSLGIPTLYVSLEMSREELEDRLVSHTSKVHLDRVLDARHAGVIDSRAMAAAAEQAQGWPLNILDASQATMATVSAAARRIPGLGLVVIDYVQLLESPRDGRRWENRQTEMADISKGCKRLAKERRIPVVALAQLSREPEKRPHKRPITADLRESGQWEQDSDLVILLYRDELYNEASKDKGVLEQIVAKQRMGPFPRTVKCGFLGQTCTISNLGAYLDGGVPNQPDDDQAPPPEYPDPDEEF